MRTISLIKKQLQSKGSFFYLNLLLLVSALVLIRPLFYHQSWNPAIFGYSARYLMYLALCCAPLIFFALLILFRDANFNRVLFFVLLSLFGAAELALTFRQAYLPKEASLGGKLKPYVMFIEKPNSSKLGHDVMGGHPDQKVQYTFNELGFRIEDPLPLKKPSGQVRVFVLGGSAVYHGSPLSNSIPGQLQPLFHREGHTQIHVYNFGMSGYVSGQELSLLVHTLVDYQPDFVIVYDGGNDVYNPYVYDPRPGYPSNFMAAEANFSRIRGTAPLIESLGSLLYRSKVVQWIFPQTRYNFAFLAHGSLLEEAKEEAGYGTVY